MKEVVMKKEGLRIILMFGVLIMLAVSSVQAQTSNVQTADIPFEFSAGGKTFPAGRYSVTRLNPQSDKAALAIKSMDGSLSKIILTTPIQANRTQETARLIFTRYEDRYFLSEVWTPADSTGLELPKSRSERSLARKAVDKTGARVAIALDDTRRR
jgi:hypothetical protein